MLRATGHARMVTSERERRSDERGARSPAKKRENKSCIFDLTRAALACACAAQRVCIALFGYISISVQFVTEFDV